MAEAYRGVDVTRIRNGVRSIDVDRAATEEPLEVRLHNRPFSVIMRTPGSDRELAAGFLLAEGVLKDADDLGAIEYCTDPKADHPENIVNASLTNQSGETLDRLLAERRNVTTNSSCGLCGRLTIDSLRTDAPPLSAAWTIAASTLVDIPDRLRRGQAVFKSTGGLHAAGLFTREGRLETIAEDVGRHNAVDKLVGAAFLDGRIPLPDNILMLSGRISFELVQKALMAGIPIVAAVGAASSLAIETALHFGLTLAGFVRGERYNVYSGQDRLL
jgi:FdhD protein